MDMMDRLPPPIPGMPNNYGQLPPGLDTSPLTATFAAPDVSTLPNVNISPLDSHLQYLHEEMGKSAQRNSDVDKAMADAATPPPSMPSAMDDYARLRAQFESQANQPAPAVPGAPQGAPIDWHQMLPGLILALIDHHHAATYAGMPYAVANQQGQANHDAALQKYQADVQAKQEHMANIVKELGLAQDQAQMEEASRHAHTQEGLQRDELARKNMESDRTFGLDQSKLGLDQGKLGIEQAQQREVERHNHALEGIAADTAKSNAQKAKDAVTETNRHNQAMEKIGADNAKVAGFRANSYAASVTNQGIHAKAEEGLHERSVTNAENRTKFEFPGGIKAPKLANTAEVEHEVRTAQAKIDQYTAEQHHWANVAITPGLNPQQVAKAQENYAAAGTDLVGARSSLRQAQAALDAVKAQNVKLQDAGIQNLQGHVAGQISSIPGQSGKKATMPKKADPQKAKDRSDAQTILKTQPNLRAELQRRWTAQYHEKAPF